MDLDMEYIYEHYVESSNKEDYTDETAMMQEVLANAECAEEHKCTAAPQMLAYGRSANSWDEYLRMSENTCRGVVARFATVVVEVFGPRYLREPTVADTERLLGISKARRWPKPLKALQEQYQDHVKKPTIILEVVASQDLWVWHAFFGMPGSHNDINVLQRSSLFARLTEGKAPPCLYIANGHEYNMGYYCLTICIILGLPF
ncbi:uncharacterized protein [Aegilops tauschii subsp. strangulata]|uniref:uncharacterized protein n=1 Tax=Aegilops tauschii subsp. strangulata TaxID=200361 RepID=UPI003CC881D1